MADLPDYNFELLAPDAATGVQFGIHTAVTVEEFDPGQRVWRTQDVANPTGDGFFFGQDQTDGPLWSWRLSTDETSPEGALGALAQLGAAWSADSVRGRPGAVMGLRYSVGGRDRYVFGRPRDFAPSPDNGILGGYMAIDASFQCASHLHFGDQETRTLGIIPATVGGLEAPLASPLSTVRSGGQREGQITVAGDVATPYVTVTFHGPVTAPRLTLDGWAVQLSGSISAGRRVTLSGVPWWRTALWENGGTAGGRLSRGTRLSDMVLRPGAREAVFSGSDATGTALATVSWRPAYRTL